MRISGFGPRAIPFGTSNEEEAVLSSSVAISRFERKNLMVYDVAAVRRGRRGRGRCCSTF